MQHPGKLITRLVHKAPRGLLALAAIVLLLSWSFPVRVQASAGDLDPAFGNGGKVMTAFPDYGKGYSYAQAYAVTMQLDGKLLVAGTCGRSVQLGVDLNDFALARYNPDGSLDQTFGSAGMVHTDFGGSITGTEYGDGVDQANAIAVLSDGRILAAGSSDSAFALACYHPDGNLDTSFGTQGKVLTDFPDYDLARAYSLALQPDGKLLVAGKVEWIDFAVGNNNYVLARYNPDGTLDQTFGSGGIVTSKVDGFFCEAIIRPDGRILVAGSSRNGFALSRFMPDGTLDPTFGSNGTVAIGFSLPDGRMSGYAYATSVALTAEDQIVAAGQAYFRKAYRIVLARFNRDGSLDLSFGSGGKVVNDLKNLYASALVVQPDGRLVVAGTRSTGDQDFLFFRYRFDGSLDEKFGSGGMISTDFGQQEVVADLAMSPDGRLVAVGHTSGMEGRFALACYKNDINLETMPQITGVEASGKSLFVYGKNFDAGAKLCLDGEWQKTANDELSPTTMLIGKKAGKKIAPGGTVLLRVMTADGRPSNEHKFTRPAP